VPDRVQQVRLAQARVTVDEQGLYALAGASATAAACANRLLEPITNVSKVYLEFELDAAGPTGSRRPQAGLPAHHGRPSGALDSRVGSSSRGGHPRVQWLGARLQILRRCQLNARGAAQQAREAGKG
jgi:hypothetical protein